MVLSKTMPSKMPVLINNMLKMELVKFVTILVKLVTEVEMTIVLLVIVVTIEQL
jgi:hypothetical protein